MTKTETAIALWEKDPKHFEAEGIPRGYCGICEVCGEPVHTRVLPRLPQRTGVCDAHYEQLNRPDAEASTHAHWVMLAVIVVVAITTIAILGSGVSRVAHDRVSEGQECRACPSRVDGASADDRAALLGHGVLGEHRRLG